MFTCFHVTCVWKAKCIPYVFQVMEFLLLKTSSQNNSCWNMLEDTSLALMESTGLMSIQKKMHHFFFFFKFQGKNWWCIQLHEPPNYESKPRCNCNFVHLLFLALMVVKIQQDLKDSWMMITSNQTAKLES